MKRFFLTVLTFLSFGAYNRVMAAPEPELSVTDKSPDFSSRQLHRGRTTVGNMKNKGVYEWENGDKYEGRFVDGSAEGDGVYDWKNGDRYEGGFVNGEAEGFGKYEWTDDKLYNGRCPDQGLQHVRRRMEVR